MWRQTVQLVFVKYANIDYYEEFTNELFQQVTKAAISYDPFVRHDKNHRIYRQMP